jgi:hypothetical protein
MGNTARPPTNAAAKMTPADAIVVTSGVPIDLSMTTPSTADVA